MERPSPNGLQPFLVNPPPASAGALQPHRASVHLLKLPLGTAAADTLTRPSCPGALSRSPRGSSKRRGLHVVGGTTRQRSLSDTGHGVDTACVIDSPAPGGRERGQAPGPSGADTGKGHTHTRWDTGRAWGPGSPSPSRRGLKPGTQERTMEKLGADRPGWKILSADSRRGSRATRPSRDRWFSSAAHGPAPPASPGLCST